MAEIDSIYQHLCTNSVSSTNFVMHETLSVSTSPRSSPCWGIGYKTIRKSESKGELFISFIIYFANKSSCINFFSVVAFYAWMFTSKHLAKPVRKTWKNQPASSLGKAVLKD
ncbi:unnamed protein product [Rotaria magnacalcarata]